MINWIKTSIEKPPENIMVDTILESGAQLKLMRQGNLYFTDGSNMYVYYIPIMWKIALKG